MKKRILLHSLVFCPDGVSTAYLYGDIARMLKKDGWDVRVLTTTPHYNRVASQLKKQPAKWLVWGLVKKSDFDGIPVYHIPQKKFNSTFLRLSGFVYWHIISFIVALFMKRADIIVSPSPPLTIGVLNVILGKLKKSKVVYNVQEVYPDILNLKPGVVNNVLRGMERFIYNRSTGVTTIDKVFYDTIVGRVKDQSKLHIIPNFVDTEIYRPLDSHPHLDPKIFKESDSLKLLYAGNIGLAQDWDTLIAVAKKTLGEKIEYYVIGEGVRRNYLKEQIERHKLTNIRLLPYQPRELMPEIMAFSDVNFIFMEPDVAAQGFPSKVYTIMAVGKPLLVCSPEGTPLVNFLKPIGCAELVTDRGVEEKASKIAAWLETTSRGELKSMGLKGLDVIKDGYSKESVCRQYSELFRGL